MLYWTSVRIAVGSRLGRSECSNVAEKRAQVPSSNWTTMALCSLSAPTMTGCSLPSSFGLASVALHVFMDCIPVQGSANEWHRCAHTNDSEKPFVLNQKFRAAGFNFTNSILRSLPPEAIERLLLRPVELHVPRQLESPGEPVSHLIFPEQGAASMTTTFADGSQVEIGLYGYESVIGISALMGTKQSLNRVYMQIPGNGFVASVADGRREFQRGEHFQRLALAFVQAQLIQTGQSAGCNAKHTVEQRLARWLLTCADRSKSTRFVISQDFIATMLGIRRMSASAAIAELKTRRVIEHHRNEISLVNRQALESEACECYGVVRQHLDSYAEFDSSVSSHSSVR